MITLAAAASLGFAIVTQDQIALRAAPRAAAGAHVVLSQGESVEVRGERLDYLQVYDHRRERAGFVHASQVRRVMLSPEEAPELLSILRFLRGRPGNEALGIGFAAAFIRAAPAEMLNGDAGVEALEALGALAERLARRAHPAHLEVAARYGVNITSHERDGRVTLCYDGEAFRRVLAMRASEDQRAGAALALTREACRRADAWSAEVLDRVDADALPGYLRNRVLMRRAAVWSSLAYQLARKDEAADAASERALSALAAIDKSELADGDAGTYRDAAMRVGASRWASARLPAAAEKKLRIVTSAGRPGETCVALVDAARRPLVRRCTYAVVWAASATANPEGTALALAVQPTETWRELWLFHKARGGWTVRVLPPAATQPGVGYAEFAGWVPGGAQVLVAREAFGEGRYTRSFEVVRLATLSAVRRAGDRGSLAAFSRWQDPAWRRQTVSVR